MIPKRRINALQEAALAIAQSHAPASTAAWMPAANARGQVDNTPPGSHFSGEVGHLGGGGLMGEVTGESVVRPQSHPQGTGSLADSDGPNNAVLLGQGVRAGGLGGSQTPFKRYSVTNKAGKLLEAHDYGGGDIKYFARKNPALLQAAAQQAAATQMHQAAPAMPAGLAPEDLERIKMLLGNPTLSR